MCYKLIASKKEVSTYLMTYSFLILCQIFRPLDLMPVIWIRPPFFIIFTFIISTSHDKLDANISKPCPCLFCTPSVPHSLLSSLNSSQTVLPSAEVLHRDVFFFISSKTPPPRSPPLSLATPAAGWIHHPSPPLR